MMRRAAQVYSDDRTAIPRNSILCFRKVPIRGGAQVGAPGGRSRMAAKPIAPAAPMVPISQQAPEAPKAPAVEHRVKPAYPESGNYVNGSYVAGGAFAAGGGAMAPPPAAAPVATADMDLDARIIQAMSVAQPALPAQRTQLGVAGKPGGGVAPPQGGGAPWAGYICKRCNQTGHYIKYCPTNDDPAYDRRPLPHGIPASSLRPVDENDPDDMRRAYRTASGALMCVCEDSSQMVQKTTVMGGAAGAVPEELACPLCKALMAEATIIPCCSLSFCDGCIRDALNPEDNRKEKFQCPNCQARGISPDSLIPNRNLRQGVEKFKVERQGQAAQAQAMSPSITPAQSPTNLAEQAAKQIAMRPQQPQMTLQEAMLAQQRNPKIPVGGINGNWQCSACGNVNWAVRANCNRCPQKRPSDAGPQHMLGKSEEARKLLPRLQAVPAGAMALGAGIQLVAVPPGGGAPAAAAAPGGTPAKGGTPGTPPAEANAGGEGAAEGELVAKAADEAEAGEHDKKRKREGEGGSREGGSREGGRQRGPGGPGGPSAKGAPPGGKGGWGGKGKGGPPPRLDQWGRPVDQWGRPMPTLDQWGRPMPPLDQWGRPMYGAPPPGYDPYGAPPPGYAPYGVPPPGYDQYGAPAHRDDGRSGRHRDRDRDRDRRHRRRSPSKRDQDRDKAKSKDKAKDKDKAKARDKDKDKARRTRRDKEKEKEQGKEQERDKKKDEGKEETIKK
jgi:hypothetical protein